MFSKKVMINSVRDFIFIILNIGYVTILNALTGIILAFYIDNTFEKYFKKKKLEEKPAIQILFEIMLQTVVSFWVAYFFRNVTLSLIPKQTELKYFGFDVTNAKDITSGSVLTMYLMLFQSNLNYKIAHLKTIFT